MFRRVFTCLALAAITLSWAQAFSDDTPILRVHVDGIRNTKGVLGVAIYSSRKGFPIHFEHVYDVQWLEFQDKTGSMDVLFDALPPGEYAVSVLHDENNNHQMERSKLGFPEEGVGFSNNQKVVLSAPSFKKCAFPLAAGEEKTLMIQLDYRE